MYILEKLITCTDYLLSNIPWYMHLFPSNFALSSHSIRTMYLSLEHLCLFPRSFFNVCHGIATCYNQTRHSKPAWCNTFTINDLVPFFVVTFKVLIWHYSFEVFVVYLRHPSLMFLLWHYHYTCWYLRTNESHRLLLLVV